MGRARPSRSARQPAPAATRRRHDRPQQRSNWSLGDPALGVGPEGGPSGVRPRPVDEREQAARREDILDYLRGSFRFSLTEDDFQDVIQATWAALLERPPKDPVRDLRAYVAEVAWRKANKLRERPPPVPVPPYARELTERLSLEPPLADRVDARARIARLTEALAQLGEREREALRLCFVEELQHDEAADRLGISRSAYFKRLRSAKDRLEGAMELESHHFSRRQRRLLSDYVAGIATEGARARAKLLIASDPHAAALARELRRTHEAAAAILPAFVASDRLDGTLAERLGAIGDRLRDAISSATGRNPEAVEIGSSPVTASGGARGAGAAGAGVLAKLAGGLGAGKVALGCLGGGALATLACVATGVIPLAVSDGQRRSEPPARAERAVNGQRATSEPLGLDVAPSGSGRGETQRNSDGPGSEAKPNDGAQQAPAAPAPTLAPTTPPEVQEFGVEGAGVPVGGAPPDANDSDGASASTVRQEFGP